MQENFQKKVFEVVERIAGVSNRIRQALLTMLNASLP